MGCEGWSVLCGFPISTLALTGWPHRRPSVFTLLAEYSTFLHMLTFGSQWLFSLWPLGCVAAFLKGNQVGWATIFLCYCWRQSMVMSKSFKNPANDITQIFVCWASFCSSHTLKQPFLKRQLWNSLLLMLPFRCRSAAQTPGFYAFHPRNGLQRRSFGGH